MVPLPWGLELGCKDQSLSVRCRIQPCVLLESGQDLLPARRSSSAYSSSLISTSSSRAAMFKVRTLEIWVCRHCFMHRSATALKLDYHSPTIFTMRLLSRTLQNRLESADGLKATDDPAARSTAKATTEKGRIGLIFFVWFRDMFFADLKSQRSIFTIF